MKKPSIPELPKTVEGLEKLLKKEIKVLWESKPISAYGGEYRSGNVAMTSLILKCPFCGMRFGATRKSGCFMNIVTPKACPNCNFPNNVINAFLRLVHKKKEK